MSHTVASPRAAAADDHPAFVAYAIMAILAGRPVLGEPPPIAVQPNRAPLAVPLAPRHGFDATVWYISGKAPTRSETSQPVSSAAKPV